MQHIVYSLPKRGNSTEEYEDAFAGDSGQGHFAVADGASESSFARSWADLLVKQFVQSPILNPQQWGEWSAPLRDRWLEEVGGRTLPWYAEAKLAQGAFATFLGLVVDAEQCHWQAISIGDSCLFQIRDGILQKAFPIQESHAFGRTPWLLGSRTLSENQTGDDGFQTCSGDWQVDDYFLLMTDALAQWFLSQMESGKTPRETVEFLVSENPDSNGFAEWIAKLREEKQLHNDDATLMVVRL